MPNQPTGVVFFRPWGRPCCMARSSSLKADRTELAGLSCWCPAGAQTPAQHAYDGWSTAQHAWSSRCVLHGGVPHRWEGVAGQRPRCAHYRPHVSQIHTPTHTLKYEMLLKLCPGVCTPGLKSVPCALLLLLVLVVASSAAGSTRERPLGFEACLLLWGCLLSMMESVLCQKKDAVL